MDYTQPQWVTRLRDSTGGSGIYIVFDGVGGRIRRAAFEETKRGGRIAAFGGSSGSLTDYSADQARESALSMSCPDLVHIGGTSRAKPPTEQALNRAAAGQVRPVIGQTFSLRQAAHPLRYRKPHSDRKNPTGHLVTYRRAIPAVRIGPAGSSGPCRRPAPGAHRQREPSNVRGTPQPPWEIFGAGLMRSESGQDVGPEHESDSAPRPLVSTNRRKTTPDRVLVKTRSGIRMALEGARGDRLGHITTSCSRSRSGVVVCFVGSFGSVLFDRADRRRVRGADRGGRLSDSPRPGRRARVPTARGLAPEWAHGVSHDWAAPAIWWWVLPGRMSGPLLRSRVPDSTLAWVVTGDPRAVTTPCET